MTTSPASFDDPDPRQGPLGALRLLAAAVLLGVLWAWLLRKPGGAPPTPPRRPGDVEQDRSLRYPVPVGQDPAAVVGSLDIAGYDARMSQERATHDVVVTAADGGPLSREDVRTVIGTAGLDMAGEGSIDGPVLFDDETADDGAS